MKLPFPQKVLSQHVAVLGKTRSGKSSVREEPDTFMARKALLKEERAGSNGNGMGIPLGIAVKMWPTPAARDQKGENGSAHFLRPTDRPTDRPTESPSQRSVAELCDALFAPGPADPRWRELLAERPYLAPAVAGAMDRESVETEFRRALRGVAPGRNRRARRRAARIAAARLVAAIPAQAFESDVCELDDGLALRLDESRADQLRCAGNGVVALQSAAAAVVLVRRALA